MLKVVGGKKSALAGGKRRATSRACLSAIVVMAVALVLGLAGPARSQDDGAGPAAQQIVTLAMNDGKIETAVAILSSQIDGNVSVFGGAAGARVTVLMEDQPIESALSAIANPNGFVWWREDNGDYGIADREYYERNVLPGRVITKVFRPQNVKASELDQAIRALITPNVGSSVADDRTNKLIINDLPQALERIEAFIREIDVQLVIRVFYIRHADVEEIASKIENYKSGPGTIEVDTTTHQIIVTDLLSNIKKMELLIDILDVGPEIVIYDVNNIGIEGEDLEELKNIIDKIRTDDDRLLFEVNEKQGVFILEDVPEVHERVEQVLAGFDQPVKQVLIQSEILSTDFTRNFDFGLTQFAVADDLLSAVSQGALGGGFFGSSDSQGQLPSDSFTDLQAIFPNFSLVGDVITGNYLSQTVLLQYQAVYNDTSTRTLLQPRVLVKNQQSSRIFVGREEPFLTTFFDDSGTGTSRRTSTQSSVTSGLTFEVTPSISNSYLVELDLQIDNDDADRISVVDAGTTTELVARDRQQVETILQIPSGQTRMIGGLIRSNESDGSAGFPFVSSIPYIGSLFGRKTSARNATNLLIFITPSIVEDVLPRETTEDGRRGRLVTDYERVPGEFDIDLGLDRQAEGEGTAEEDLDIDLDNLLSGDAELEAEELNELFERERARREAQEAQTVEGNYTPAAGFGNATLNTGERAPTGSRPAPNRQPARPPGEAGNAVPIERVDPGNRPVPGLPGAGNTETRFR